MPSFSTTLPHPRGGPLPFPSPLQGFPPTPPSTHSLAAGEMTTTSTAFAVRRLHLDWPRFICEEKGRRSRWTVGVVWWELHLSPARHSCPFPSLSILHQLLAATSTSVTPNDTWSYLQGFTLAT